MTYLQAMTYGTRWTPNSDPKIHALPEGVKFGKTLCGHEGERLVLDGEVRDFDPDGTWSCQNCARRVRKERG